MIQKQIFGRTNHKSSRLIFGGYALNQATKEEAAQTLEILLQSSINHIDTAPMYGKSQERVGDWMKDYREEFFLATKTRCRDHDRAINDLYKSLEMLNTDYIDLWQMHGLTNPQGWEKAMGSGGVLEAFIEAKEEGLVRYVGVTGYGNKAATVHLKSIEKYDFDAVMLPYNFAQYKYTKYMDSFNELYKICEERNIAFQVIKSIARGPWWGQEKTHNTYFYQPLIEQKWIDLAVHWALGLDNTFIATAGDTKLLPKVIAAAKNYKERPSEKEMQKLVEEVDLELVFNY